MALWWYDHYQLELTMVGPCTGVNLGSRSVKVSMQLPASGGRATEQGDRRRPNREKARPSPQQPQPCSRKEASLQPFFLANRPCAAATWARGLLALCILLKLLTLAGAIQTNPRLKARYTCPTCTNNVTHSHGSICYNTVHSHWTHLKCSGFTIRQYTNAWKCNIHRWSQNHTDTRNQITEYNTQPRNTQQIPTPNIGTPKNIPTTNRNLHETQGRTETSNTKRLKNTTVPTQTKTQLEHVLDQRKIDVATLQETKLEKTHKTP